MEKVLEEREVIHHPELARHELGPNSNGVLHLPRFVGGVMLRNMQMEAEDPTRVAWHDNHNTYVNKRGLTIVQNHDVYALKLSEGDQEPLRRIPHLVSAAHRVTSFIQRIDAFPGLETWKPDELSLHRYDDPELGLSFHKDNQRFVGVIAILAVEGVCRLLIRKSPEDDEVHEYVIGAGDLVLLRAPELYETEEDIRPEHSVGSLLTPTRTSMMLRDNNKPRERVAGFRYENW